MNVTPFQRPVSLADVPLERIVGNSTLSESEKVGEISRQFEAILLRQILQQGQKTVFASKFQSDSATSGIYQDMITNQLADGISRSGTLGLAQTLQTQLTRQVLRPPSDPLSAATVPSAAPSPAAPSAPSPKPPNP